MSTSGPSSAWQSVTTSGYDVTKFYCGSSDAAGANNTQRVKVGESFVAQFHEMRERKEVPPQYRTFADLVRDAIVHRLKYLASEGWTVDRLAALMMRETEMDRVNAERASQTSLLSSMQVGYDAARMAGDVVSVREVLDIARNSRGVIRDPYTQQLRQLIADAEQWLERVTSK